MPLQRTKAPPTEVRDIVFVSHATPADNDFARWLAFRLTREGYRVWVDLSELKGGEDWWRDIEHVIRKRAVKFLAVVSRTSNERDGVLKEIAVAGVVARTIKNFIVPLRIDDLPFGEFNIEIKRYNGPDFSAGWAPAFTQLLEALERDGVAKPLRNGAQIASERWHEAFGGSATVKVEQEIYGSNWLPVDIKPTHVWWHERNGALGFDEKRFAPAFPVYKVGNLFFSFAAAADLEKAFGDAESGISRSASIDLRDFTRNGLPGAEIEPTTAKDAVTRLYRDAIERHLMARGLARYDMASGKSSFWFPHTLVGTSQLSVKRPDGSSGRRAMVGKAKEFTWHFAVELRPAFTPWLYLAVIPHVVFAENNAIIQSKRKQHSLRRRVCKQWFNDQWFDRILVALNWLGGEANKLVIPLGSESKLEAAVAPNLFASPVTYSWTPAAKATAADAPAVEDENEPLADDDELDDELDDEESEEGAEKDEHTT